MTLFIEKPKVFTPKFEVVSCIIEHNGTILLLLRQHHKSEPNTYGLPAGKVNSGEDKGQAMYREVKEETGMVIKDATLEKTFFVQYPAYEFIFYMYYKKIDILPNIIINPEEHQGYTFVKPIDALSEPLIQDQDECIKIFYKL